MKRLPFAIYITRTAMLECKYYVGAANLKPNTFAHLNNPTTSWGFKQFSRKLFSWQSTNNRSSTFGQNSKNRFDKHCEITSFDIETKNLTNLLSYI